MGSSLAFAVILGVIFVSSHVGESTLPVVSSSPKNTYNGLQEGFYIGKCPNGFDVQAFIEAEAANYFKNNDSTILPAMLRLQFHDCFVNGCDASVLIAGTSTERAAGANTGVRGFEFLDFVKAAVELKCPGVVSCADIIAICTNALIKEGGGQGFKVQTGRRDGTVSRAGDVNLPDPSFNVSQTYAFFQPKNFSLEEMVLLLGGGHTVGVSECRFFQDRLYNDTSAYDPLMDSSLRNDLILLCPENQGSTKVAALDENGLYPDDKVDNSFYNQILHNRGLLPIDQTLARDITTAAIVAKYSLDPVSFQANFGAVMIKLQAVGVKTGKNGNIRNVCSKLN